MRALCKSSIVLEKGMIRYRGPIEQGIDFYMPRQHNSLPHEKHFSRPANENSWLTYARLATEGGCELPLFMGDRIAFEVHFRAVVPIQSPHIGFVIHAQDGTNVLGANTIYQPRLALPTAVYAGTIRCDLGCVPLMAGPYTVSLWFGSGNSISHHVEQDALQFTIHEKDIWGSGFLPFPKSSHLWWPTDFNIKPDTEPPQNVS
jgi:hypothetical protein